MSGLTWHSIRLRSIASVDGLIRPLASATYRSHNSETVIAARAACRSADGSPPVLASLSLSAAKWRASFGVSSPTRPRTNRRVRPSLLRYCTKYEATPLGFTRTPNPFSAPSPASHLNTSRLGSGLKASTTRLVSLDNCGLVSLLPRQSPDGGKQGGRDGEVTRETSPNNPNTASISRNARQSTVFSERQSGVSIGNNSTLTLPRVGVEGSNPFARSKILLVRLKLQKIMASRRGRADRNAALRSSISRT